MARPSWGGGLGSAIQEIRHCFSRFAIARLCWRRREVLKRRRGVFERGKEDQASSVHIFPFCCVVSLSRPVRLSQRALQNFNLFALSSSEFHFSHFPTTKLLLSQLVTIHKISLTSTRQSQLEWKNYQSILHWALFTLAVPVHVQPGGIRLVYCYSSFPR